MGKVRTKRVFVFLCLTIFLSWGYDWLLIELVGFKAYISLGMSPWGMLVPAFSALILQIFFFKDSCIYYRTYKEKPRLILYGFLLVALFYGVLVIFAALNSQIKNLFQGIGALLYTLWTLLIFFVYSKSHATALERTGLLIGNIKTGQRFIFGIIIFFLLQTSLNLIFDMGEFIRQRENIYSLSIPSFLYIPSIIILFISVTVIGIPLSGLAGFFGEEYGWRGFLQSELIKAGKLKGVIAVGIIWGVWHFPIILRGIHTYPSTLLGLFLGLIFFTLWGIIQGYAVLKTGSLWIAAFMHGLVNSVYNFTLLYLVKPNNNIVSFGLGVYGLLFVAVIVIFILRDSIWIKDNNYS